MPPSWSRAPETRAIRPGQDAKVWARWLYACALPLEHIAIVLELDLAALDACINRASRKGPVARIPTGPPRRHATRSNAIHGPAAANVYTLRELGYPPPAIARILDVPMEALEDLLSRCVALRRAALVRPRSRPEQARLRPPRPRREPPPAPPEIPADELWRHQDGASPFDPPIAPAAAELVADQAVAETPPPPREPWVGRTSPGGSNPKLTEEEALEVMSKRAAGWSVHELAADYEVARNTIYAILNGRTYPHLCPALPAHDALKTGNNP